MPNIKLKIKFCDKAKVKAASGKEVGKGDDKEMAMIVKIAGQAPGSALDALHGAKVKSDYWSEKGNVKYRAVGTVPMKGIHENSTLKIAGKLFTCRAMKPSFVVLDENFINLSISCEVRNLEPEETHDLINLINFEGECSITGDGVTFEEGDISDEDQASLLDEITTEA